MDPLIINAAITGAVFVRGDSPCVPLSISEMVACARSVCDAGASILHLHARGPEGEPSYSEDVYGELVERVREVCPGAIVCVSLSGRFQPDLERRAAGLAAHPDMASLTLGSFNFPTQASINTPGTIQGLAQRILATGAVPELEVFEAGFINTARYLIRKDILQPPYYFNLLFGALGAAPLDLQGMGYMVSLLPPGATWAAGGLGRYQLDANVMAIAAGGHVRVGLEDNLHYDRDRKVLADNPRLVERIVRIAREMGRDPATTAQARAIIGLRDERPR